MNRLSVLGLSSIVAGLFLVVMKMLASITQGDPDRFNYTLLTVVGSDRMAWVDVHAGGIAAVSGLASAPLFVYFLGLGFFLVLISGLNKG